MLGVDVADTDDFIDWKEEVSFGIIRASEGLTIKDKYFARYWKTLNQIVVPCGCYHFFHPKDDGEQQAKEFIGAIKNAGGIRTGNFPPIIDLEVRDGCKNSTIIAELQKMIHAIAWNLSVIPMIYCSPGFVEDLQLPKTLSGIPLWVAHYGVNTPEIPTPWSDYWIHQFQGDCRYGSIPNCDLNRFNFAKEGDSGDRVCWIWEKLRFTPKQQFTSALSTAVKSYQSRKNLTVDGIVGAQTFGYLAWEP